MGKRKKITVLAAVAALLLAVAAALYFLAPGGHGARESTESGFMSETVADSTRRLSIVFAGDLMQHLPQIESARRDSTYDFAASLEHVAPFFRESDLVVINLETTLSDTPPYSGYPQFCAPAVLARDMKDAGIDAVLLANNHICDKAGAGIGNTVTALTEAGLLHTGAFADSLDHKANNPLLIEKNGFRVYLLNYTYGTNGLPVPRGRIVNLIDTAIIARDLEKIEPGSDRLTFVCVHWGIEYATRQSGAQESLAEWLRSKGVDFIIGGHPHVIQPLVTETDSAGRVHKLTAYSLGNFISNQQRKNTDGGMVLRFDISRSGSGPMQTEAGYALVWTYRPTVNDRREFYALPSYSAAQLLQIDSIALKAYDSFAAGARNIIGTEHGLREITEFASRDADSD